MNKKLSGGSHKKNQPLNFFYICLLSFNAIFLILAFLICVSLGACFNWNILWGMMIHVPFVLLGCLCTILFNKCVFHTTKSNQKGLTKFLAFLLEIIKYVIILCGLLIGLIVNVSCNHDYFNYYSLAVCTLIYPCANLVALIYYAAKSSKKN